MKYYYSPTTSGFYVKDVHGDNMPGDATPIEEEEWQALLSAQSAGMRIVTGTHGKPIAAVYMRTPEELAHDLRVERDRALTQTDPLVNRHRDERELGVNSTLTDGQFSALMRWRMQLRDLPDHPEWPNISLPRRPI